jgi:CBS-domain-containing membrane protein
MFKAKDLMTAQVITVSVDDTIDRAIDLMVTHRVSGLPVLDRDGRPVGVISEFDLLELICEGQTEQDKVSHYMSRGLLGVAEEDSWVTVADMFRERRVRRLPVLRHGKLVGIVARHDLMHAIRDARQRVRRQLAQEPWKTPPQVRAAAVPAAGAEQANPAIDNPPEPVPPAADRVVAIDEQADGRTTIATSCSAAEQKA